MNNKSFYIAGHTMGTPEYDLFEAITLMEKIGAEGIEIVVQDGYKSGIPCDCDPEILRRIKESCEEHHIRVSALTPYNSFFNSLDEKKRKCEIAAIKKVVDYCAYLGAGYIRIYGGNLKAGDDFKIEKRYKKLVDSLREMGDYAKEKGVILVVENHFNTMAVSARESEKLIRDVDHEAVRILYDQANLKFTENEDYETAIDIQQKYVSYMHVKDLVFIEGKKFVSGEVSHPKEEDRNVVTKIVGEGIIPWPDILKKVQKKGYSGWLSLEYERRWHPADIPDASIGMKKSVEYLKRTIAEM